MATSPWRRVWTGFVGGSLSVFRSKVPGGWFILIYYMRGTATTGVFFYADPSHEWDGSFLPQEVMGEPPEEET